MKRRNPRNVKIIFPSTITTFSMIFGYLAVIVASTTEDYTRAAILVMFSILMDGLDGKVARFTNTASEFGIEYDSLSDLVAFGVAPAVIYYNFFLHEQNKDQVYYLLPIMFLVSGAVRLARFNVSASIYGKNFFQGLPIPAAAFMMVTLPLFYMWSRDVPQFAEWGVDVYLTKENFFQTSILLTIILSFAMISTMRFDTPATFWLRKYKPRWVNVVVLVSFLLVWPVFGFPPFCVAMSVYYLTMMFGRTFLQRLKKHGIGDDDESDQDGDDTAHIKQNEAVPN